MAETLRSVLERLDALSRMFQRDYDLIDDGVHWTPRQLLANADPNLLIAPASLEISHTDAARPGSITVTMETYLAPDAVVSGEISGVHFTGTGIQIASQLVYVVTWKDKRQTS